MVRIFNDSFVGVAIRTTQIENRETRVAIETLFSYLFFMRATIHTKKNENRETRVALCHVCFDGNLHPHPNLLPEGEGAYVLALEGEDLGEGETLLSMYS